MIRRTALVAAVLVALPGCDSEGPLNVQPESLLSLEVGAMWVFEYNRTFSPTTRTTTDTLRATRETSLDGVRWVELRGSVQRLDNCLGGFYAEIDGEVWYTPALGTQAPYRLFAREAAYAVQSASYDASVTLDRTGDMYAYTFDTQRVRGAFLPDPGDFPVTANSPDAIRVLETGSGFVRYDQDYVFFAGPDPLRVVMIDTCRRTAFLPAE